MTSQTSRPARRQKAGHRLTKAKREVLALLAEYFCLKTNDIARLIRHRAPNENDCRSVRYTLKLLYEQGLVNRLPYLDLDQVNGGLSYVYGLSDKAIRADIDIEQMFDTVSRLPLYHNVAKTFDDHSQRTLDHELEISYFHIELKEFCQKNGLKLYWQQADLKCTIHLDAYFAITDPKKPENKNTSHYFLEIERAKLSAYRDHESGIMRKLGKYYDYYNTDACEKEWNFRLYRTVIVQRTEERRENLLKELHEKHNHRMFWLTTEPLYKKDIGGEIFATPKDQVQRSYSFLS